MTSSENTQTAAAPIDLDQYKDLSVGEILHRTREHYGQSIGQVEVNLRIRASHLQAISQSVGKKNRPELQFKVATYETQTPNIYIICGCTLATILFIAYLSMAFTPTRYIEVIPPVPESLKKSTLVPKTPQSIEDIIEGDQALLARSKPAIELVITQDSWVEIKDKDGKRLLSEVLKPGDKYIVPKDTEGLTLATGNAGGITVFKKGKKIGPVGNNAEVKRNVLLTPENF